MAPPVWSSAGIDDVPSTDEWVDPALADRLAAMRYAKRRSESRLGRWTAKSAVATTLGFDAAEPITLQRIVIANAPDGAPEPYLDGARAPVNIAMTDRADWAVCALVEPPLLVGCDLELVEPRSEMFVRDYLTDAEQALVASHPEPDMAANLVWSAKESALKVLRTGLRRATRSVEVQLTLDGSPGWLPLGVHTIEGRWLPGWWGRFGPFVLTVVTSFETDPPQSLSEPPKLASAAPSHRWMESLGRL